MLDFHSLPWSRDRPWLVDGNALLFQVEVRRLEAGALRWGSTHLASLPCPALSYAMIEEAVLRVG